MNRYLFILVFISPFFMLQAQEPSASFLFAEGVTFVEDGEWQEAIVHIQKAVKLDPLNPLYNYFLGGCYYELGAYETALERLTVAIGQDAALIKAYHKRGMSFYQLGRYEEAIRDFNRVIESQSSFAEAYYFRAKCKMNKFDIGGAWADYKKSLNKKPASVGLLFKDAARSIF